MTGMPPAHESTPPMRPWGYSQSRVHELYDDLMDVRAALRDLQVATLQAARMPLGSLCAQHLRYGVARRAGFMEHILGSIFEAFPPEATEALPRESLSSVTIHLHAYLMHVAGILDNWAWAYLLRHNKASRSRRDIGLFHRETLRQLPAELRAWLESEKVRSWRAEHAADNRNALAHRIPPYIPPGVGTPEQCAAIVECIDGTAARQRGGDAHELMSEATGSLRPCFVFLHELASHEDQRFVYLHPQLIADARLVSEFGRLFLAHWAIPPARD